MKIEKREKVLSVRKMATIGVLGAISIMLGITPLGFIPIGPTKATIMHIPVIIGSIIEGPVVGLFLGLIFGLFSIFQAVTNPTPVSFVFINPLISILPRVLMGIIPYYVYSYFKKKDSRFTKTIVGILLLSGIAYLLKASLNIYLEIGINLSLLLNLLFIFILSILLYKVIIENKEIVDLFLASALGTITNTVGVLSLIYFLYGERYVSTLGLDQNMAKKIIFGIAITNGIPEIILGVIISISVIKSIKGSKIRRD